MQIAELVYDLLTSPEAFNFYVTEYVDGLDADILQLVNDRDCAHVCFDLTAEAAQRHITQALIDIWPNKMPADVGVSVGEIELLLSSACCAEVDRLGLPRLAVWFRITTDTTSTIYVVAINADCCLTTYAIGLTDARLLPRSISVEHPLRSSGPLELAHEDMLPDGLERWQSKMEAALSSKLMMHALAMSLMKNKISSSAIPVIKQELSAGKQVCVLDENGQPYEPQVWQSMFIESANDVKLAYPIDLIFRADCYSSKTVNTHSR